MKKKVGECVVDSGQIMIVDPCYLRDIGFSEHRSGAGTFDYDSAVRATTKKPGFGELSHVTGAPLACVTATGGDGRFPVYAEVDRKGRVLSMTIRFDE